MQEALDSFTYSSNCGVYGQCIGEAPRDRMISAIDEGISLTAADIIVHNTHISRAAQAYPRTLDGDRNDTEWFDSLKGSNVHPFLAAYISHINFVGSTNNPSWNQLPLD